MEVITLILRFGLKLEASLHTTSIIKKLSCGIRIHHGYLGMLLVVVSLFLQNPSMSKYIFIIGMALFLSDMIHHFLILWLIKGNPEFHLFYPKNNR